MVTTHDQKILLSLRLLFSPVFYLLLRKFLFSVLLRSRTNISVSTYRHVGHPNAILEHNFLFPQLLCV
jgi:hypothetical protein